MIVSPHYVKTVLPLFTLGQHWIVDSKGHVRLAKNNQQFQMARSRPFIDESIYKLLQIKDK